MIDECREFNIFTSNGKYFFKIRGKVRVLLAQSAGVVEYTDCIAEEG